MANTANNTWPTHFLGLPASIQYSELPQSIRRVGDMADQDETKIIHPFNLNMQFQWSPNQFYIFEGFFRHHLSRGMRGTLMVDLDIRLAPADYMVRMSRGYTAKVNVSRARWIVGIPAIAEELL